MNSDLEVLGSTGSASSELNRSQSIVFHLAIFSIAFLILFSRRPDAVLNAQFFAEDGTYWYADAYQFGWRCLLMPQVGYLNTLSRLIALFSLPFPLAFAPLVMNLCALIVQILPVNLFLSSRFSAIPFWIRTVASFLYLALPNSAEIHANTTNVQWHLGLLAFLVLAAPGRDTIGRIFLDFPALLLILVNGPLGILLIPIALLFWWKRKGRWSTAYLVALLPGAFLQGLIMVASHARRIGTNGASLGRLVSILGRQVFMGCLLGTKTISQLMYHARILSILEMIATVIGVGIVLYALRSGALELRLFILFSALIFAACLAHPLAGGTGYQWDIMRGAGNFGRYFFFPMLAFLAALLWSVRTAKARTLRHAALAILLLMPIGIFRDWRYRPFLDMDFKGFAAAFERAAPGTKFVVSINPDWEMYLTKKP